ncbi:MAG: bestrophin family protein [Chitinophagales bacterium]
MLLKQNLSLYRVLKMTWRIDILMIGLCFVAYFIDTRLLNEIHILPAVPSLIGTAMAFFVAFNNNQAYSRWWEARIIWGGIVNDSRSWSRELRAYGEDPTFARRMIRRHIGFLYALKSQLRKTDDAEFVKFLEPGDEQSIMQFKNLPNAILHLQSEDLQKLSLEGKIDGFRFLALNEIIRNFCDGMGKSERISNTVFPTTYIFYTRLFIWLLVMLSTMTLAESIGLWSVFFGWVVGFVFHASHINGMSLMNPFEMSPSSIPLNAITRTIEINLLQDLGEKEIPAPEKPAHEGEYIL